MRGDGYGFLVFGGASGRWSTMRRLTMLEVIFWTPGRVARRVSRMCWPSFPCRQLRRDLRHPRKHAALDSWRQNTTRGTQISSV